MVHHKLWLVLYEHVCILKGYLDIRGHAIGLGQDLGCTGHAVGVEVVIDELSCILRVGVCVMRNNLVVYVLDLIEYLTRSDFVFLQVLFVLSVQFFLDLWDEGSVIEVARIHLIVLSVCLVSGHHVVLSVEVWNLCLWSWGMRLSYLIC